MGDIIEEKKLLRKRVRALQKELNETYVAEASAGIAERLLLFPMFMQAETIFVYVSMAGEPDTIAIIETALALGKCVLVPRCLSGHQMEAVQITGLEQLEKGHYGILEPKAELGAVEGAGIDLALIPCVAADRCGGRLGHGAGYYDRYLRGLVCTKAVLCFERLLVDAVPMETTDVYMDRVVTEEAVYNCRKEESAAKEAEKKAGRSGWLTKFLRRG